MSVSDQLTDVYTKENIDEYLQENSLRENSLIAKVLELDFIKLATNFNTQGIAISFGTKSLLGTVNEQEYDNSPMCSPFNLFFLYPKKRLHSIQKRWIRQGLNLCTTLFSVAFKKAKFNRVVQVNNKPCDAITYPELTSVEVKRCVEQIIAKFPSHAIIFPRFDRLSRPGLYEKLEANGFKMIPTRPVHIFHPDSDYMKRSHTKRDFSLLRKMNYTFVDHNEINEQDLARIHELYQMLFIDKHSEENPNLTLQFFQEAHTHQWYRFFALKNPEGEIDAFFSYEVTGSCMACGPLGYDTTLQKELGLYRILFAISLQIAHDQRYVFNFGGGNETFKLNRGSIREIGYTAVYCRHLPLYRQFPWRLLATLSQKTVTKLFEKVVF